MVTIDSSFNFKKNSFGFLRFFLATLILIGHTHIIGGFSNNPFSNIPVINEGFPRIAVYGFFVISGFLVTRSYVRSNNIINYGIKRMLRIFPGFWINLFITAFIFAGLVYYSEHASIKGFIQFSPKGPIDYIQVNFLTLMRQYDIASLLSTNPFPYVFNGSLWTLFLEVKAYLFLGIIGIFGLMGKQKYLIFAIFIVLFSIIFFNIPIESSTNKFIRLIVDEPFLLYGTYFFAGSVCFLFKDKVPLGNRFIMLLILLLFISSLFNFQHQLYPVTFPLILIWLANILPLHTFDKYGDFSYGIYLYAFPVQQLLTYFNVISNPLVYLLFSFSITLFIAIGSWFLIEKRFLRLKLRLI